MRFRLLTYNIHKGIGGIDRKYQPERIAETISHYLPDVVALQEVDDGVPRSRRHRQVDWLAEALGFPHSAFQSNVALREGTYGNAILSQFPIKHAKDIDLTLRPKKRRRALSVVLKIRGGKERQVQLTNLHLGLAGFERKYQIRRLLANKVHNGHLNKRPEIITGDFNDVWGTLGKNFLLPAGFLTTSDKSPTFPAALPVRRLDYVYFRGSLRQHHELVGRTRLAREASDHLPVIVDFEFG